jgi:hypothetical protein
MNQQKHSIYKPELRKVIKFEDVRKKIGWKKIKIEENIIKLRQISTVFCYDFSIQDCLVYVVDILDDGVDGIYYPLTGGPDKYPKILLLNTTDISTYFHELVHHLQYSYYKIGDSHGYYFQLAKNRVANWISRNVMTMYACSLNVRGW